ncbi:peptidase T [Arsenicicoccus dermatophilus]|uniref:peptidase T n=1 Tax=Arsenicicoccus dermatophilus TaxID=1076331 RepID=UPI001F4CBB57|nr:peptidase T [Arsenicicoccus dermatophilus]
MDTHGIQDALVERFLRYSAVTSQGDAAAVVVPSTPGQRELAELLRDELVAMGAADVHLSDTAVLTARIPSTLPDGHPPVPAVGFCAHLDTVDVDLCPEVHARVVEHDGGDVCLDRRWDRWIRVAEHPELARYAGDRLLVTDGTSVLGADDKAAISVLMEAAAGLLDAGADEVHGDVHLAFVPDEEIGLRGVRTLDLDRFPVRHAWTIDCCELGELVTETFNAATATIRVEGVTAHPMAAKGVLVNPILVATDVIDRLDRAQTPERTEGREGYLWVDGITGGQAEAVLTVSIRDHDRARFAARKTELRDAVEAVRAMHPRAVIELAVEDVYGNIADSLAPDDPAVAHLLRAMGGLGIEPLPLPMRGGTDGSWLSRQGIPTPNFFTGAHNFHSTAEFLPLSSFERSHALVRQLVRVTAGA